MKIEVRLFASLGAYLPDHKIGDPSFIEVKPEATVGHILDRLKVPTDIPKM
ncbi:MAG: MoaD/ThiS family protein, partial [Deltaproteobacteria bacterium]|nr:MoaD/ThiS family protein [Deltaproteobacteria bacterium]